MTFILCYLISLSQQSTLAGWVASVGLTGHEIDGSHLKYVNVSLLLGHSQVTIISECPGQF